MGGFLRSRMAPGICLAAVGVLLRPTRALAKCPTFQKCQRTSRSTSLRWVSVPNRSKFSLVEMISAMRQTNSMRMQARILDSNRSRSSCLLASL